MLYYRTFQDTVKMFYFFSLFLCVICAESIINLLQYSVIKYIANCVSWVSRLTFFVYYVLSRSSHVQLFAILWTVARQAPLSMGFSRQECWSGLPCPPPGDLPNPGIEPMPLMSPALAGGFFTTNAKFYVYEHALGMELIHM